MDEDTESQRGGGNSLSSKWVAKLGFEPSVLDCPLLPLVMPLRLLVLVLILTTLQGTCYCLSAFTDATTGSQRLSNFPKDTRS